MSLWIKIKNFKGTPDFEGEIGNSIVSGRNKAGKSNILSAVLWIFADTDLDDHKSVKVQQEGKFLNLDIEVEIKFGGFHLGKIQKENWVKNRITRNQEFKGNQTEYYSHGKKIKQKEYNDLLESFKIEGLSPKEYFMSFMVAGYFPFTLDKAKREKIVYDNIKKLEISEVANIIKMPDLAEWYAGLDNPEKTRSGLVTDSNDLSKNCENLETRIKENRTLLLEELPEIDTERKAEVIKMIEDLSVIINADSSKAMKKEIEAEKKDFISAYIKRKSDFEISEMKRVADLEEKANAERNRILEKNIEIRRRNSEAENERRKKITAMDEVKERIRKKERSIADLRTEFLEERGKVFSGCICPILKENCEVLAGNEDLKKLEAEFNTAKSEKLAGINSKGQKLNSEIEELKKQVFDVPEFIPEKFLEVPEKQTFETAKFSDILDTSEFDARIEKIKPDDKSEFVEKRQTLETERDNFIKLERDHEKRLETIKRISDLEKELKQMSDDNINKQRMISFITKFNLEKARILESDAEEKFGMKIKLFDFQVNGQAINCCEFLDEKGVELNSSNNATRINSGIFLCERLQNIYGVDLPVLADNTEGVEYLYRPGKILIAAKMVKGQELKIEKMES